jgi:two-component system sensor histidine kinase UhpB
MTATILVVDDSEDDRCLYQRAFKGFDCFFNLVMTSSAEEGLASAIEHKPDLILLDYNLPDLDGLSFMDKLAAHSDMPTPIIMLTGEISAAVAVEAMKHGADDYLVKDTEGSYLRLLPGVAARVLATHVQHELTLQLQKKTEALLLRNQILMQNSMDGIHIMDMQGNIIEANDAFCRMLGYTQQEIICLNLTDIDAQWSAEEMRERIGQLLGKNAQFETVHRRKDGTLIKVEICSSWKEIEGQYFLFGASRDITERKKAAAGLQKSEANLRAMLDNSPYLTWLKDTESRYITINKVFADYLRLEDASHVVGKTDLELQPKELAKKYIADDAEVMETRQKKHVEESAFDGNTTHWVETYKTPIIDGQGNVLGTVGFARDITERKRSEEMLRKSEASLKDLFENLSSGVAVYRASPDGQDFFFTAFNRTAERIENVRREDLIGKNVVDVFPGVINFGLLEVFRRVWQSGVAEKFPISFYQDGHIAGWRENFVCKLPNAEIAAIYDDVTRQKQAEEKILLESKAESRHAEELAQRFGHLLQSSFNEIYLFDANTLKFILTSEGAEKNLGYSDEELKQLTPLDLKNSYTQESFESMLVPLRNGEQQTLLFESTHCRKNGTTYPVEIRLQLMGEEHQVFLAIVQDITERKMAEEEMRFHSNILKNLAEGIVLVRASDGRIVFTNAQFEHLFGYQPDELLDKSVSIINAPSENTPEEIANTILSELAQSGVWSGEVQNIRKDGTKFWCRANVSTFEHFQFGKVWVSVHEDITERKFAEQQAHELSAHLQTVREEEKASIAREVHDDLGSTLAALKMDAYWLAGKLAEGKEQQPLQACAKSMSALLDTAVLATRRIITDLRPTILDELGLMAALKWQCAEFQKRTSIKCHLICIEDEGLEKKLDKLQRINLFRIAQEALTNVARHADASKVAVDLHQKGNKIVLKIRDNGRGLPNGHIIPSASYGMRGMRERVASLHGEIKFDTPTEGGFSLVVKLPLLNGSVNS